MLPGTSFTKPNTYIGTQPNMTTNEKTTEYRETRIQKPSSQFHPFLILFPESTGGGIGGKSLPLSLEIVATNISQDGNEGTV